MCIDVNGPLAQGMVSHGNKIKGDGQAQSGSEVPHDEHIHASDVTSVPGPDAV